jgi:anti-sigma factor RsiW
MGCPVADNGGELIVAYVARTLAEEQETEIEQHLGTCGICRQMVEAQRAVWLALDAWPASPVSSNFDESLLRCIAMEERRGLWRRWWPASWSWRPAVPVGVACAALITMFLLRSPVIHMELQLPPNPQIEQVEHALDDMDLLTQLGVENASDKTHPSEKF